LQLPVCLVSLLLLLAAPGLADPSETTVTGQVELLSAAGGKAATDPSEVVVWLTPLSPPQTAAVHHPQSESDLRLIQRHKSFAPHLLVVQAGSVVQFPNQDPFFHNVFSLFEGKRFDLGLYEAGSSRAVRFDKPGISYLFCNIHPEMSAVVITLKTPYYGVSDRNGHVTIPGVPPARYKLQVWNERSLPEELTNLEREVTISEDSHWVGTIPLYEHQEQSTAHKNKYGRDYDAPTPPSSVYTQP
jgi:plastocyanin